MIKRLISYLLRIGLAFSMFLLGSALYLVLPPFTSSIKDLPREPPIALVTDSQNKGMRCKSGTFYVAEKIQLTDVDVIDPHCADLQSKLAKAAGDGDVAVIRSLLARGANPESPGLGDNWEMNRPLSMAVRWSGKLDAVRLLLDNGGDPNEIFVCCAMRSSLLTLAVERHDVDVVRLLLARGARIDFRDFDGERAREIALREDYWDIIQVINEAGGLDWKQRASMRIMKLPGLSWLRFRSKQVR